MSDRWTQLVALVVLVGGLVGAYLMTPAINQSRVDRQLTYDVEVGDDTNPAYTLAASLGSFRGLAVNVLWQRSEALKQEGKFFEANNLAEMITTFQPRYPEAWNFQGWNMAYNISVKCKTPEERWDWVQKGMNLLRDRGIPNNPNAVVLYRSLAWILGHKMSGGTDDMHWYYKARFAETWQVLMGVPDERWMLKPEYADPANRPPDEELDPLIHGQWIATEQFRAVVQSANTYLLKPERVDEDYNPANYFTTLSPDGLARFYADHPGVEAIVRQLEQVAGPDGEALELGLNTRTLRAIGRLQMYSDAGYPLDSAAIDNVQTLGMDAFAFKRWMGTRDRSVVLNFNPMVDVKARREQLTQQNPKATLVDFVPVLNLLRAQALVAEYHMDPAYMLACMERFGPLDWRHPSSHACYWTALGTLRAEQWTQDKDRVDFVNANRATIHALQKLAHEGKITFRPNVPGLGQLGKETINHTPDIRMIPAYDRAWQDAMDKIAAGEFGDNKNTSTYENGHENFLQAATYLYYFDGRQGLARKYFDRCKALYANRASSPAANDGEYNLSLPDFARVRLEDDLGFQGVAMINYWIRLAWKNGLSERDRGVMGRYLSAAKQIDEKFRADRQTTIKNDPSVQARQDIPPFEDLVLAQFLLMMNTADYSLPQKSGIWQLAGPLLVSLSGERPLAYEAFAQMMPILQSQAQIEGWGAEVLQAFPEPKGFTQWYEQQLGNPPPAGAPLAPGL